MYVKRNKCRKKKRRAKQFPLLCMKCQYFNLSTGSEGRAGMVAIVDPEYKIDLTELCAALQKTLPPYSRPLFVRLMTQAADTTGIKIASIHIC